VVADRGLGCGPGRSSRTAAFGQVGVERETPWGQALRAGKIPAETKIPCFAHPGSARSGSEQRPDVCTYRRGRLPRCRFCGRTSRSAAMLRISGCADHAGWRFTKRHGAGVILRVRAVTRWRRNHAESFGSVGAGARPPVRRMVRNRAMPRFPCLSLCAGARR